MFNKLNLYLHLRVSWSLRTRDGEFDLAKIFLNVKCMKTVRVSPRPRRCCRTETQVLSPTVLSPPLLVNTIIAQVLQHRNIFAVDVIFVAFGIRISLSEEIGMQQFDILE